MSQCTVCGSVVEQPRGMFAPKRDRCWGSDCLTPAEAALRARHQEIVAGKRCMVPISLLTTCVACGDAHTVRNDPDPFTSADRERIGRDRGEEMPDWPETLPCPCCPAPCKVCGSGKGYCRKTPCGCRCHVGGKAKVRKASKAKPRAPSTIEVVDNRKAADRVVARLSLWRDVLELSLSFAWRWDPIDLEIVSVLVRQDGSAEIDVVCPSLRARAIASGCGYRVATLRVTCKQKFNASDLTRALQSAVADVTEHAEIVASGTPMADGIWGAKMAADRSGMGVTQRGRLRSSEIH